VVSGRLLQGKTNGGKSDDDEGTSMSGSVKDTRLKQGGRTHSPYSKDGGRSAAVSRDARPTLFRNCFTTCQRQRPNGLMRRLEGMRTEPGRYGERERGPLVTCQNRGRDPQPTLQPAPACVSRSVGVRKMKLQGRGERCSALYPKGAVREEARGQNDVSEPRERPDHATRTWLAHDGRTDHH